MIICLNDHKKRKQQNLRLHRNPNRHQPPHKVHQARWKQTHPVNAWKQELGALDLQIADALDFSGKGMIWLHDISTKKKWEFTRTDEGSLAMMEQVNSHAIFDTFSEDLSVFEAITTFKNWFHRSKISGAFCGLGTVKDV